MTTTVLIADDDPLARSALVSILGAAPDLEVLGCAADGVEAVELAARLRPDVVVMDIRMPRLDGVAATRKVAGQCRVLALTTFTDEEYVYDALRAGASGFLLKSAPPEQLAEAVRIIAGGEALLAPAVTRMVVERYVGIRRDSSYDPKVLHSTLTPRELEVMRHVAQGLNNREIAETLTVAEPTVKTHVARILHKLELRDRAQVVVAAYESGLLVPGRR
jgi:DNA-binding NarL/FixJ family response regulator